MTQLLSAYGDGRCTCGPVIQWTLLFY